MKIQNSWGRGGAKEVNNSKALKAILHNKSYTSKKGTTTKTQRTNPLQRKVKDNTPTPLKGKMESGL